MNSQNSISDTSFVTLAKRNTVSAFTKNLNSYSDLYNGRDYDEYRQTENEHPYLFLDWSEGELKYSGKVYENVPLLFDLSTDEIITEHSSGAKISLVREKVSYFIIRDHRYEHFKNLGIEDGFYEVLYSGKLKIVSKHKKKKEEKIVSNSLHYEFNEGVKYYLLKEGQTFQLSNRRSLIKILSGDNGELKKKLTSERVDSKSKENSFARLAMVYDQLTISK